LPVGSLSWKEGWRSNRKKKCDLESDCSSEPREQVKYDPQTNPSSGNKLSETRHKDGSLFKVADEGVGEGTHEDLVDNGKKRTGLRLLIV